MVIEDQDVCGRKDGRPAALRLPSSCSVVSGPGCARWLGGQSLGLGSGPPAAYPLPVWMLNESWGRWMTRPSKPFAKPLASSPQPAPLHGFGSASDSKRDRTRDSERVRQRLERGRKTALCAGAFVMPPA